MEIYEERSPRVPEMKYTLSALDGLGRAVHTSRFAEPGAALARAEKYIAQAAARLGVIKRIIVTKPADLGQGEIPCYEWVQGKGVLYNELVPGQG